MPRRRKSFTRKRPNSPFRQWDWTIGGHRFRGSTGETNEARANEIALNIRRKLQDRLLLGLAATAEMTVQEAMTKAWTDHFQHLGRADTAWHHIASLTRRRQGALLHGGVLLSDIGDAEVVDYMARRRGETRGQWRKNHRPAHGQRISPSTINAELTVLATCLKMARHWKINGMKVAIAETNIRAHRLAEPQHVHTDLPDARIDEFIASIADHAAPMICLYLWTGLRKSNVIGRPGLWWQWLDLDSDKPHARVKVKGDKMQTIWLPPAAVELLKKIEPDPKKRRGPVFRFGNTHIGCECTACMNEDKKGKPILSIRRTVATARKKVGLPDLNLHDLRHKFGRIVTRRFGLKAAQQALGHADMATTARFYADQEAAYIAAAVTESVADLAHISHTSRKRKAE
ncbi:MAG: tyrosine-type recombinase/integrase [Alphaproteobacteria bacterium]|nr:tyrosine-type recombinase/integrase [Alphaproteobacteria bacterium]